MMAKNKNRASKAAVQTSPGNKLPVPDTDVEIAEEVGYDSNSNPGNQSALNKQNRK